MRFTYLVYYSKKDTNVTKEKREKEKETKGGTICTEPDVEDEFSANTSEPVLGDTTEKEGTMVSNGENMNTITSTTIRNSSQESCETNSFYKSNSNLMKIDYDSWVSSTISSTDLTLSFLSKLISLLCDCDMLRIS